MKKQIVKISLSSIFTSLGVVFILIGTALEALDLTVAAICSFITYISMLELDKRYALMIYFSTSVLCLIVCPFSSAMLYYIFFFGYYPVLKAKLRNRNKLFSTLLKLIFFNFVIILLMLLFKAVFAMQNEPYYMYIILLVIYNFFFVCFDRCIDVLMFVYMKKIRPKLPNGRN